MPLNAGQVHEFLQSLAPVVSVRLGDPLDKSTWAVEFDPAATQAQKTAVQSAINAFDPSTSFIPLDLIQTRMENEGAWDTYVNFAFGTATRRNAFLKVMFIGKPIRSDSAAFRTSMTNAGIAAAAQDRILASP